MIKHPFDMLATGTLRIRLRWWKGIKCLADIAFLILASCIKAKAL